MLTTELLPLSKAVAAIGSSLVLTSLMYEYFRETHTTVRTMTPEWMAASAERADGHVERVASPVPVELNPARREKEHARRGAKSVDMGGWF